MFILVIAVVKERTVYLYLLVQAWPRQPAGAPVPLQH